MSLKLSRSRNKTAARNRWWSLKPKNWCSISLNRRRFGRFVKASWYARCLSGTRPVFAHWRPLSSQDYYHPRWEPIAPRNVSATRLPESDDQTFVTCLSEEPSPNDSWSSGRGEGHHITDFFACPWPRKEAALQLLVSLELHKHPIIRIWKSASGMHLGWPCFRLALGKSIDGWTGPQQVTNAVI